MEAGQLGKSVFKMKFSDTVLIVGFGSIGRRHTNNILKNTNSKIVIFSHRKNIDFTEFQNYHFYKKRIQIYNNFECCLKEKPSVAFITNETSLHIDFALKLAKMNVDLFIEKPLSHSMTNLTNLGKIINKNNLIVMVGCNFRFYPPIMKIKEIVFEGIDGKKPKQVTQDTGEWKFRDVGGYDRTYHLNRIMMAAAMADGTGEPVKMDQASWIEKYNSARPYTEAEHNMMKTAFKTIDSDYIHTEKDHKSKETPDTNIKSPYPRVGRIKNKNEN